jgi:hypothetical protein
MPDDPLSAAQRFRKVADEFSDKAKSASTRFIRDFYQRIAQRYLLHAENQMKLAKMESVVATEPGREDHISIEPFKETPSPPSPARPVRRRADGRRRSRRPRPGEGGAADNKGRDRE